MRYSCLTCGVDWTAGEFTVYPRVAKDKCAEVVICSGCRMALITSLRAYYGGAITDELIDAIVSQWPRTTMGQRADWPEGRDGNLLQHVRVYEVEDALRQVAVAQYGHDTRHANVLAHACAVAVNALKAQRSIDGVEPEAMRAVRLVLEGALAQYKAYQLDLSDPAPASLGPRIVVIDPSRRHPGAVGSLAEAMDRIMLKKLDDPDGI